MDSPGDGPRAQLLAGTDDRARDVLPRFLGDRARVGVAHKTGDFPPLVLDDVGIIVHDGGPTVVSVFVNANKSGVLAAEETIGRIAEDLVTAWSQ